MVGVTVDAGRRRGSGPRLERAVNALAELAALGAVTPAAPHGPDFPVWEIADSLMTRDALEADAAVDGLGEVVGPDGEQRGARCVPHHRLQQPLIAVTDQAPLLREGDGVRHREDCGGRQDGR